jgi:hypothetical protein
MKTESLFRAGLTAALLLSTAAGVQAQGFTKADSGWVRIFNGTDFTGLYSRTYGSTAPLVRPVAAPYIIQFAGTDTATIRANATSPQGNFGTDDTTFSHYRLRWESKYDAINGNSNSGMTYHMDEKAIRMQNNWPRSIEFQGKQSEIGSAFSIQQVTFTTNATGNEGSNYSPTAPVKQGCEYGCNGRWYKGNPLIRPYEAATPTVPRWLRFHLIARGADSAIHIVNDTTVLRLWNIRIFNDSTRGTASNMTPTRPWDHGGLGWQAEGAIVNYRRLEVMKMPASTPMNEHFLHRLFLDAPEGPVTFPPANSTNVQFLWRSIGTIPFVKIEYRHGSGSWMTVTASTPNTGSYSWASPSGMPGEGAADFRITSADYVWGDSTSNPAAISSGAPRAKARVFTVKGGALVIPRAEGFARVDIRDPAGRMIRSLPLGAEGLRWDLTDSQGAKVRPGLYLLQLTGESGSFSARALIF